MSDELGRGWALRCAVPRVSAETASGPICRGSVAPCAVLEFLSYSPAAVCWPGLFLGEFSCLAEGVVESACALMPASRLRYSASLARRRPPLAVRLRVCERGSLHSAAPATRLVTGLALPSHSDHHPATPPSSSPPTATSDLNLRRQLTTSIDTDLSIHVDTITTHRI